MSEQNGSYYERLKYNFTLGNQLHFQDFGLFYIFLSKKCLPKKKSVEDWLTITGGGVKRFWEDK